MRRRNPWRAIVALCLIALMLAGCAPDASLRRVNISTEAIANAIVSYQPEFPEMADRKVRRSKDATFTEWASRIYGIDTKQIEDACIIYASGMELDEVAVFKSREPLTQALEQYVSERADQAAEYSEDERAKVDSSIIENSGQYTLLFIGPNANRAQEVFSHATLGEPIPEEISNSVSESLSQIVIPPSSELTESPAEEFTLVPLPDPTPKPVPVLTTAPVPVVQTEEPVPVVTPEPTPTPTPVPPVIVEAVITPEPVPTPTVIPTAQIVPYYGRDAYDYATVINAWRSGSPVLSPMNGTIYNAATQLIAAIINEDMTDYEKELTIHDWLVNNIAFDEAYATRDWDTIDLQTSTPYGALINRLAICSGYATTFELLMNMLNIPCISVIGMANGQRTELHQWNMVQLNGAWYCVDVTWDDDPNNQYAYFNKTSAEFAADRQWDTNLTPVATGGPYAG